MAEIVGAVASAVTLVALFKNCIDAFDAIRAVQKQALELNKLTVRLNIERCRLYIWGQALGLTSTVQPEKPGALDSCPYPGLVLDTLGLILDMFEDSKNLKEKYGCASVEIADAIPSARSGQQANVIQQLSASFNNFKTKTDHRTNRQSLARKTYWVIRDRKKFEIMISEAKALIDGLQDII